MYKVFIDNHCITIDKQLAPEVVTDNFLLINEPQVDDIHILVEYLSATSSPIDLFMLTENIDRLWLYLQNVCPLVLAAGGVVKNNKNEILFIHRSGYWDLPKGKVENDEDLEKCAIREVQEECGFEVNEIKAKLPSTYHIYFYKTGYVLKETHWYEMYSEHNGKFVPQEEEGIDEVRWFSQEDLSIVKSNTYQNIKELLNKII